jgi:hypothetical protein
MNTLRMSFVCCLELMLMLGLGSTPALFAADTPAAIVGNWEGTLDPGGQPKKKIVVHVSADQDGTLTGTIDLPDQQTSGIQLTVITYKAGTLHFESTGLPGSYDGTMSKENSQISGKLTQGGH